MLSGMMLKATWWGNAIIFRVA